MTDTLSPTTISRQRREALHALFTAFDLDGNGAVGLQELLQVVQSTRRLLLSEQQRPGAAGDSVLDKRHKKRIRMLEAEIRQAVETNRKTGGVYGSMSQGGVALSTGGALQFDATDGEPSLDPVAFVHFLERFTAEDTDDEFSEFARLAMDGVQDAVQRTTGSALKSAAWSAFQLLDRNQDGFVELSELTVLHNATATTGASASKADRKTVMRWRALLAQRKLESRSVLAPIVRTDDDEAVASAPTLALADVPSVDADDDDDDQLLLSLADFQHLFHELTDGGDAAKAEALHGKVREAVEEEYLTWLDEHNVKALLDTVLEDLLRERPKQVLEGIERSVARMKRTGRCSQGAQRVESLVRVKQHTTTSTGESPLPSAQSRGASFREARQLQQ